MTAKQLVTEVTSRAFGERGVPAVDVYFAPSCIQCPSLAAPGILGLRRLVPNLAEGFCSEPARVLADARVCREPQPSNRSSRGCRRELEGSAPGLGRR
jgi:hypothetical protein